MSLDTTIGGASSDSYATLAECKAYWDMIGFDYSSYSDALIEEAMRRAVKWLDGRYRDKYPGFRRYGRQATTPQALEWPRTDGQDVEGYTIPHTTIPQEIKDAQCEAAKREVAGTTLSPDVTRNEIVTSERFGPLATTYAASASIEAQRPTLTVVEGILSALFQVGRATKWLLRA